MAIHYLVLIIELYTGKEMLRRKMWSLAIQPKFILEQLQLMKCKAARRKIFSIIHMEKVQVATSRYYYYVVLYTAPRKAST